MKNIFTLLVLLLAVASQPLHAQNAKFSLDGTVLDSTLSPIESATVVLLKAADSTMESFSLTNKEGAFSFTRIPSGDYLIQVSFLGYHNLMKKVTLSENKTLQPLELQPLSVTLEEVEISAERTPIMIKGDTIQYNADAFKTQPGSVVEDLLKKLPGVEVDRDGNVKAMGEDVQNILVDGKEFFGNDPKVATKNLPADAIDNVKVYDKKSDMAEFTGVDDGRREKTINLELKEDKKKGVFGKLMAGYGTEDRFNSKLSLNKFGKKLQLSVLGMANNVNEQGFSLNDYINFMGGMQNMMGGGGGGGSMRLTMNAGGGGIPLGMGGQNYGFMNTGAGGVNFNYDFGKKTELSSSYFYNRMTNDIQRDVTRQQFLNNETFDSEDNSKRLSTNHNHRVNLTLKHQIDSSQNLILRSSFGFNDAISDENSNSQTFNPKKILENAGERISTSEGQNYNVSTNLIYRKRLKKKGRSFVADLTLRLADDDQQGSLYSVNSFSPNGINAFSDTIQQTQGQVNEQLNYGAKVSYTEPLGKRRYLEFNYSHQNFSNEWDRTVYDIVEGVAPRESLNDQLSNHYRRGYTYDNGGISIMKNRRKSNLTVGVNFQRSHLDGEIISADTTIQKTFKNVLPRFSYHRDLTSSKSFDANYVTSVQEPSLEQLQPIVDNTNPLNIYVGNPDLRPEYSHNLTLHFMSFSQFTFTNIFGFLRGTYTANKITNAKWVDSLFRQTTQPINVANDLRVNGMISFGRPLKFIKSRFNIEANSLYNRAILFINNQQNQTNRLVNNVDVSLENRKKEVVDIVIGADLSYNITRYSEATDLNQDFLNQVYYADLTIQFAKTWSVNTSFDYSIYAGDAFNEDQKIPLWRASLTKYLLKHKRGQLRFSAFDLLNKNQGINRSSSFNYIQEERIATLSRYFMVSFTYNLSQFGSSGGSGIDVIRVGRRR